MKSAVNKPAQAGNAYVIRFTRIAEYTISSTCFGKPYIYYNVELSPILGPLLFIVYIADDINIFIFKKNSNEIFATMNKELYELSCRFKLNTFLLNVKEANFMV